jgi:hypothetical protein
MSILRTVYNRLVLPIADDLRLVTLPAEEVFHLASVLRVVEDVAHGCGMPSAATPGRDADGIQMIRDPLERVSRCSHLEYEPDHLGFRLEDDQIALTVRAIASEKSNTSVGNREVTKDSISPCTNPCTGKPKIGQKVNLNTLATAFLNLSDADRTALAAILLGSGENAPD